MRWLAIFVAVLFSVSAPAALVQAERKPDLIVTQDRQEFVYFGSRKTNKFHRSSCQYVQRIKAGNVVGFRSREEAIGMGYVPCKVCRP